MIYPNPRHLHAFVTVVQLGSMVKAAKQLHLGQPALSQAIGNLEQQAGLRLFNRTTRSLNLTPAGDVFYHDALNVLEQNRRLVTNIRQWADAQQGSVCVMSIPSIAQWLLPQIVQLFHAKHPLVAIDVHDLPDPLLASQIQQGKGDVAIQTLGHQHPDALVLPVLRDPVRWLAPRHHPMAVRQRIRPQDMSNDTWILMRKGSVFRDMVEPVLREHPPRHRLIEVDQLSTLISMVSNGMGVSLIPALCCPSQLHAPTIHRPWNDTNLARTIILTRPRHRELMPAPQQLIHALLTHLEQHPSVLPEGVESVMPTATDRQNFLHG